jgi:DNA mismatch repair ATPase MutS
MQKNKTAKEYYIERLQELEALQQRQVKRKTAIGWLRLAIVIGIAICFYFLWSTKIAICITIAALLAAIFIKLLLQQLKNNEQLTHTGFLIAIQQQELQALEHNFSQFYDGARFNPQNHNYSNDLDIFAKASLYQFCNRTTSAMGQQKLASWLLQPATFEDIALRQQAINELVNKTTWRQNLQAVGLQAKITNETQERLDTWLKSEPVFKQKSFWTAVKYIAPIIMLTVITCNITNVISSTICNYFLLASAILAIFVAKKIAPVHNQVSKMANELAILSNSIALIEQQQFTCPLLQQLKASFSTNQQLASSQTKQLKKIVERLDLRLNPLVFIPLAVVTQWDVWQALALEKWKANNAVKITEWFNALATFEALHSFATLKYNNSETIMPQFVEQHFALQATEVAHPLINPSKCVKNSIDVTNATPLMLVTGSNMAGKSTYLRSIGVNIVLAMAGAPVFAKSFLVSPVELVSSMRIADNLEESTSTFYAELKKLKAIIEKVNDGQPIFILLDEILRGTNSEDRHAGSSALIKQLLHKNAAGIIATHDVELAKSQTDSALVNYNFDVQVNGEELYFDYKIKKGICTSLNATILMKKIGIEL